MKRLEYLPRLTGCSRGRRHLSCTQDLRTLYDLLHRTIDVLESQGNLFQRHLDVRELFLCWSFMELLALGSFRYFADRGLGHGDSLPFRIVTGDRIEHYV
jgi:hypothetical protein